jgi:hypothetical protein
MPLVLVVQEVQYRLAVMLWTWTWQSQQQQQLLLQAMRALAPLVMAMGTALLSRPKAQAAEQTPLRQSHQQRQQRLRLVQQQRAVALGPQAAASLRAAAGWLMPPAGQTSGVTTCSVCVTSLARVMQQQQAQPPCAGAMIGAMIWAVIQTVTGMTC